MSVHLRNQTPILRVLCKTSPKVARDIIKTADNDFIKCICECSNNLLRGNISVSSKQKSKLKRHKKALRDISKKKVSLKRKRKIIQTGAFLAPLLLAVVPAILNLLGCVASRYSDG